MSKSYLPVIVTKNLKRFSTMITAQVTLRILKAIGTIEIFSWHGTVETNKNEGILRLDILSKYESTKYLNQLLYIANLHFYNDFGFEIMISKAIPYAKERITSLMKNGFTLLSGEGIPKYYKNYFIRKK